MLVTFLSAYLIPASMVNQWLLCHGSTLLLGRSWSCVSGSLFSWHSREVLSLTSGLPDSKIPRFQARGLKRIVLERSAADFISNSFNADWARLRTVKTRCYQLDQKLTTATVTRQPSFNGRVNEEHCTWRPLVGSSLSTHLLLLLERNTWPFQVI